MTPRDPLMRDRENADPHELQKPIPRLYIALVVVLLSWAVGYIFYQSPGMDSSSSAAGQ